MNKKAKYIFRIIGALFLDVGSIGFLAGFWAIESESLPEVLDSFELPLGELSGIAIDSEGNIYCGLMSYSRVQVYDTEGEFLFSRFIDRSGGAFRIRINENDQLEVATARSDKLYIFEKDGTLVRVLLDAGHLFSDFGETGKLDFTTRRRVRLII